MTDVRTSKNRLRVIAKCVIAIVLSAPLVDLGVASTVTTWTSQAGSGSHGWQTIVSSSDGTHFAADKLHFPHKLVYNDVNPAL